MPLEPEIIDRRADADPRRRDEDIAALRELSRWMDGLFELPALRLRFGLDPILGLLPGVGDLASTVIALYILQAGTRLGASRLTLARMSLNLLLDWAIGSIPILGDAFDVYWKANERNVRLLERHLDANPAMRRQARRGDWLFFAAIAAVLILFLVGSLMLAYLLIAWIGTRLFSAPG